MKNEISQIKYSRPLTKPLLSVALTLILNGIGDIIFADYFRSLQLPVDPPESMVYIFIGASLLFNLVYSRFLAILYCVMVFLGSLSFFLDPEIQYTPFKLVTIFSSLYYGICTWILIADQLKYRKIRNH